MAPVLKTQVDVAAIPDGVKQRTVPRVKEDGMVEGYDNPEATYCYVFETLHGTTYFLNADQSMAAWAALMSETEDEDMGAIVGQLFKLDPRNGMLKWAGAEGARFDVYQLQLDRLALNCTLVGSVE